MSFDKKEYDKQYYLKNKDKINLKARERPGNKEKHRQYYLDHKEEFSRKAKERYLKNKEEIKAQVHKRYLEKHDEILEYRAEYYQENKERMFELNKKWVLNNKDKVKIIKARYRDTHRDKLRKDSIEYSKTHQEKRLINKRKWRARNPDRIKEEKLKARFGITLNQFNELKKQQNNCCGICGEEFGDIPNGAKYPCVDHIHDETKRVRGLLCRQCNGGLGGLRDDPAILEKAIMWIKNKGPIKKEENGLKSYLKIRRQRKYSMKRDFGITIEQFKELLKYQGNRCGICGKDVSKKNNIDHCHDKTKKIRGILCPQCNISIGLFKENVELLNKAMFWLEGNYNANS